MKGHKRAAVQADIKSLTCFAEAGVFIRVIMICCFEVVFFLLQSWCGMFSTRMLLKVLASHLDLSEPGEHSWCYQVWFWMNRTILKQKQLKALFLSLQWILPQTLIWVWLIDVHSTACRRQRLQPGESTPTCAAQLFFELFAAEQMWLRLIGNVPHCGPTKANKTSHVLLVWKAMQGRNQLNI